MLQFSTRACSRSARASSRRMCQCHPCRRCGSPPPYLQPFAARSIAPTVSSCGSVPTAAPAVPMSSRLPGCTYNSLFCRISVSRTRETSPAGAVLLLICCGPAAMFACRTKATGWGFFTAAKVSSVARHWLCAFTALTVRVVDQSVSPRPSVARESPWCDKPRFAHRSMAQTRSVGKACRLASWRSPGMNVAEPRRWRRRSRRVACAVRTDRPPRRPEVVTPAQAAELRKLIGETESWESRFCAPLKMCALEELPPRGSKRPRER